MVAARGVARAPLGIPSQGHAIPCPKRGFRAARPGRPKESENPMNTVTNATPATDAPAVDGAPVATVEKVITTTEALLHILAGPVKATRKDIAASLSGGLKAACSTALLAWNARALGATREQIAFLILGKPKVKDSDGGEAKVYRAGLRLAADFMANGVPSGVAGENDFSSAVKAVLVWAASKDVRSLEGLMSHLSGGNAGKGTRPLTERVISSVKTAATKGEFSVVNAAAIAAGCVKVMGIQNAAAFVKAAQEAYDELSQAAREAAEREAAALVPSVEPEASTGTEG